MPRGDKTKYSKKQIRQAQHIQEGYEAQGMDSEIAEKLAWSTINKLHGGGKMPGGSGRRKGATPRRAKPR